MSFDLGAIGKEFGPTEHRYDWREVSLYALACGAGTDELDLVLDTRGPKVLPTFSVVPALDALKPAMAALGGSLLTVVHGAQRCTALGPIDPEGTLSTVCIPTALYDKGKGALAVYETRTRDARGREVFSTEWQLFFRGEGGFGGERGPDAPRYEPPAGRAPDHVLEMKTLETQALLYRLLGDTNPLHSEPAVATSVGFPRPILHGLCTFGHACRAAVRALAGGDPTRITQVEGRFTKPVLPGDTIVTRLWSMDGGEAFFETAVAERDDKVITLGRVLFAP